MARLSYLNDPERRREFDAAGMVYATRSGQRIWVCGGLDEAKSPHYKVLHLGPDMEVPISNRLELQALLHDCRETKGMCVHEALNEYDRLWPPMVEEGR